MRGNDQALSNVPRGKGGGNLPQYYLHSFIFILWACRLPQHEPALGIELQETAWDSRELNELVLKCEWILPQLCLAARMIFGQSPSLLWAMASPSVKVIDLGWKELQSSFPFRFSTILWPMDSLQSKWGPGDSNQCGTLLESPEHFSVFWKDSRGSSAKDCPCCNLRPGLPETVVRSPSPWPHFCRLLSFTKGLPSREWPDVCPDHQGFWLELP